MSLNNFTELIALIAITYVVYKWRWLGAKVLMFHLIIFEQVVAYHVFYLVILRGKRHRTFVMVSLVVYSLAWIIVQFSFQDLVKTLQFYSYAIGVFGILISVILFFYEHLLDEQELFGFVRSYP